MGRGSIMDGWHISWMMVDNGHVVWYMMDNAYHATGGEISQASYNDLEQTHANGISNLCKIAREIGLKEGVVVVIRVKQKN